MSQLDRLECGTITSYQEKRAAWANERGFRTIHAGPALPQGKTERAMNAGGKDGRCLCHKCHAVGRLVTCAIQPNLEGNTLPDHEYALPNSSGGAPLHVDSADSHEELTYLRMWKGLTSSQVAGSVSHKGKI